MRSPVLGSDCFKGFFIKNFNFRVLSRETYRKKYFYCLEQEERQKTMSQFNNLPFSLYVDVTIDSRGCKILNVMRKPLSGENKNIVLLYTVEIEVTSADYILKELLFLLPKLIQNRNDKNMFKCY